MKDISELYLNELKEEMATLSEKPFRAAQVFSWLHEKTAVSFDEMTNLPLTLREKLASEFEIRS